MAKTKKTTKKVTKKTTRKKKETKEIAKQEPITLPEKLEKVLIEGDLAQLSSEERVQYYNALCKSVGLNPLTKPFEYIKLNGRLTLYALKACTEQLRKKNNVSIYDFRTKITEGIFIYTAFLQDGIGRKDIGTGAVSIKGLSGPDLANAFMKGETKAKRRGTLSISGLGILDESELDSIISVPDPSKPEISEPKEKNVTEEPTLDGVRAECDKLSEDMLKSKKFDDGQIQEFKAQCKSAWTYQSSLMGILREWTDIYLANMKAD